jgi:hypothetical protein
VIPLYSVCFLVRSWKNTLDFGVNIRTFRISIIYIKLREDLSRILIWKSMWHADGYIFISQLAVGSFIVLFRFRGADRALIHPNSYSRNMKYNVHTDTHSSKPFRCCNGLILLLNTVCLADIAAYQFHNVWSDQIGGREWIFHRLTIAAPERFTWMGIRVDIYYINITIKRHNNRTICCITSSIPTAPTYGGYISHMMRYSKSCGYYRDFLERELLQTKGSKQFKLKSSLRTFYDNRLKDNTMAERKVHKDKQWYA